MEKVALIIPCYNESQRLDFSQLEALVRAPGVALYLVDDGSRDTTLKLLREFAARFESGRVIVHAQPKNSGKAEAVRTGLQLALQGDASVLGYLDADFATSAAEVLRVLDLVRPDPRDIFMGARVRMLGRSIRRGTKRHYLGRVFATFASLALGLPTYDTQCGFKLFRRTDALVAAVAQPFSSRWIFDVELLSRMLVANPKGMTLTPDRAVEIPLNAWEDKAGSRLTSRAMVRAAWDLWRLGLRISAQRRQQQNTLPGAQRASAV